MQLRAHVSAAALVAALVATSPANAQTAATSAQSEGPQAAQDTPSEGIADIVVTANKQNQTLQKAPVAITAVSGEALVANGVLDIRAVQQFVPSVRLQQQNQATEVYVRGVGLTLDQPEIDPPVSINFNGVYMPREATSVPLYDVSQVEVLPGPQGTLYGRSSLGGVVNVNFKRPTFDTETHIIGEAGNYGLAHATIVQNVPLTQTLAMRGAFDYLYHSGYNTSGGYSANDWSGRLSVLWKPDDRFTAYIWGTLNHKGGVMPHGVVKGVDPATGLSDPNAFLQNNPWNDIYPDQYTSGLVYGQPTDKKIDKYHNSIFGAQFDYELGDNMTLSYIPSYLNFSVEGEYWLGALPNYIKAHDEQNSHELRLSGKSPWGSWLVGAYGYHMITSGATTIGLILDPPQDFPLIIRYINAQRNSLKGLAGFGQATIDFTDQFHLTVGGRYGVDHRTGLGYPGSAGFPAGVTDGQYTFARTYRRFDYKVLASYDITPRVMAYAGVQTGFQPGTYNEFRNHPVDAAYPDGDPNISNAVEPAKLTAFTAGFKSRLFDGKLQFNNEFFYYDYRNLFVGTFSTNLGLSQIFNAKKVEIYGDQLDLIYQPGENDRFNFSVGYLHARNKDFVIPLTIPSPTGRRNFNGLPLQYAPTWTINAGYQHDFHMAKGYVRVAANTHYESQFYADFFRTPGTVQKAYTKTDASMTYYTDDGRYSIGAWIKNIENEAVIAAAASGSSYPSLGVGAITDLEAPRTYGIRATMDF